MRIGGIVLGSYGDVCPFINLGKALKVHGHDMTIATFEEFRKEIEESGLSFKPIKGSSKVMMSALLSDTKGVGDSLRAIHALLNKQDRLFNDLKDACKNQDCIIYMQFGALAYHFAEAYDIPCIRTFVFPFDATRSYTLYNPRKYEGSFRCILFCLIFDLMMNVASLNTAKKWRKQLGLRPWHWWSSYKYKRGKPVLTLYQFSQYLVPKPKEWGLHVHITGNWDNKKISNYVPYDKLVKFIEKDKPPLLITFGSVVYQFMDQLILQLKKSVRKLGYRAIIISDNKLDEDDYFLNCDFIPYDWLMTKVSVAIHHGGLGTTTAALKAGCPSLIVAFGGDQQFWGQRVYQAKAGPPIIDVSRDDLNEDLFTEKLSELLSGRYNVGITKIQKKLLKERGVEKACEVIINEFGELNICNDNSKIVYHIDDNCK